MAVKYVEVINSFVSTEGSNGIMTNYVYYTLLVVNTDGTREIREGKLNQIAYLLHYVRTPMDEIEELRETVKGLRKDLNEIADQKMKYVIDSLFPIPDIQNKNEVEAFALLKEAGLEPVLLNSYPESTPKNGVVRARWRNANDFKKVNVRILHDVPPVEGLSIDKALKTLTEAGFHANVTRKIVTGMENDVVLSCSRPNEDLLNVELVVSSAIPETKDLPLQEAVRLLQDAGYQVVVERRAQPGTPETVFGWERKEDGKIKLYVRIPDKYDAKHVDVKWTNMQDSPGDVYSATALFDNKKRVLSINLTYLIGAKTKHQIIGMTCPDAGAKNAEIDFIRTMEPNVQDTIVIDYPFEKSFSKLPAQFNFELNTQYGLMKKKENVNLRFTFEW